MPAPAPGTPPPRHAVSVKAVLVHGGRVLLLKNERDEWELPGGRLEHGESPAECVVREVAEETGLAISVRAPLEPYVYWPTPAAPVLILPFHCVCAGFEGLRLSEEHADIGTFAVDALEGLRLPPGYRRVVAEVAGLSGS